MNPPVSPARWTLVRVLREHPAIYLLVGMIGTVLTVPRLPEFSPWSLLLTACGFLLGGVFLVWKHSPGERIGLILVGAALVLPVLVVQGTRYRTLRNELVNELHHLEGTWDPSGTFEVHRVDRSRGVARLHLPAWVLHKRNSSLTRSGPARDLVVTGTVRWPRGNPGFARYLRVHGYHGFLDVSRIHRFEVRQPGGVLKRARARVAAWLGVQSRDYPRSASLMGALLLGRVESLPHYLRGLLRRLGISHLFVISGFHVGILYLVLGRCFDPLPRWGRFTALLCCLILYLEMLRWPVSATRAGVMIATLSGCEALGRRSSPISVLLATVVLMVLVDPLVVQQAGFQLSVGAMLGIGLLLPYRSSLGNIPGGMLALVSAGAFLGVLPVVLVWFQYLAPLGAPLGYLASFLFPLLLGLLLVQGLLMGVGWSGPAQAIESGLRAGIQFLDGWVQNSSLLVGVDPVSPLAGGLLAVGILLLVSVSSRWPARLLGVTLVVVLGIGAFSHGFSGRLEMSQIRGLTVTVTGTPEGRTVVVLPPRERAGYRDVNQLGRYLNRRGVFHVDLLVSSARRERFYRFNPTFTVGRHRVYWRHGSPVRWSGGGWDPGKRVLRVPGLKIVYKRPPFLKDISTRSTSVVAYTDRGWCFVVPGAENQKSGEPSRPEAGCRRYDLTEQSFVWSFRRRRRIAPDVPRPGLYYNLRHLVRQYLMVP